MQCKDIPDLPILEFLAASKTMCHWSVEYPHGVAHAMPPNTLPKLVRAKMRQLIKRNLATGCTCGCRGDFEITQAGRDYLAAHKEKQCPS